MAECKPLPHVTWFPSRTELTAEDQRTVQFELIAGDAVGIASLQTGDGRRLTLEGSIELGEVAWSFIAKNLPQGCFQLFSGFSVETPRDDRRCQLRDRRIEVIRDRQAHTSCKPLVIAICSLF